VMLVGRKLKESGDTEAINLEIKNLKDSFTIKRQELEDLLA